MRAVHRAGCTINRRYTITGTGLNPATETEWMAAYWVATPPTPQKGREI